MNRSDLKKYREQFQRASRELQKTSLVSLKKETPEAQEARIKKLLKPQNYGEFCLYYFPELCGSPCASFHISSYRELHDMEYIVQFRQWFRGAAKSTHAVIINSFALKQLGKIRFSLVMGINADRAIMLLSDLQMQLQFNERIIKDFGTQIKYGSWTEGAFETSGNAYFIALGINEKVRGLRRGANRLDYCVVSDCEDRKTTANRRIVAERVEKITGDVGAAFGKNSRRIVIDNNYFVRDGIVDGLKKAFRGSWVKKQTINLTNADGTPSWPERYSDKDIEKIHQGFDSFTLKREYYNTPIVRGKIFKEEQILTATPGGQVHGAVGHWDLSYVTQGDYKAFALAVVRGDRVYIEDLFCRQCEIADATEWHYEGLKRWYARGIYPSITYDATASQEAVFLPIFEATGQQKGMMNLPMPYRITMDKHARIEATLGQAFFYKKIVFSKKLAGTPDFEAAKDQLLAFEKGSTAHDDFPDALEIAVRQAQLFYSGSPEGEGAGVMAAPFRETVF